MSENIAVHAIFPGGCAVLAATLVEEIEGAEWQDLGMPETLWINRVREFGPLIISIDTKGNNLIQQNKVEFQAKKAPILEKISKQQALLNNCSLMKGKQKHPSFLFCTKRMA